MVPPVTVGVEDTFSYMTSDECVDCGACVANCPVHAIAKRSGRLEADPVTCIDWAYQRSTRRTIISIWDVPWVYISTVGPIICWSCCRICLVRLNHITYAVGIPLTFIDGINIPDLPDYGGITMSVHDSRGYRHKSQVYKAVRNLVRRMNTIND